METWKPIVGYESLYEISNMGRVKSLARKVSRNGRWKPDMLSVGERILSPATNAVSGYLFINLCGRGKPTSKNVHALVATAFIGPRPKGMECCHNNGNPADNRVDNLRWDTRKSNYEDGISHGRVARRSDGTGGAWIKPIHVYQTPL